MKIVLRNKRIQELHATTYHGAIGRWVIQDGDDVVVTDEMELVKPFLILRELQDPSSQYGERYSGADLILYWDTAEISHRWYYYWPNEGWHPERRNRNVTR